MLRRLAWLHRPLKLYGRGAYLASTQQGLSSFSLPMRQSCRRFSSAAIPQTASITTQTKAMSDHSQMLAVTSRLLALNSIAMEEAMLAFGREYDKDINSQGLPGRIFAVLSAKYSQLGEDKPAVNEGQLFADILKFYDFLSEFQIGFLRGDLHTRTVFQLHQLLNQRNQLPDKEEMTQLLKTCSQYVHFWLPFKGIFNRALQDKKNLFQRELHLEEASNSQALNKYSQVMESLSSLNKLHMTQLISNLVAEWMAPMCKSIRAEITKCEMKEFHSERRHYADYLVKVVPEKLASIALSEMMACVLSSVINNSGKGDEQDNIVPYFQFPEKKLATSIGALLNAELVYDRQEKRFKEAQRVYESFKEAEQKNRAAKQAETEESDKKAIPNPVTTGDGQGAQESIYSKLKQLQQQIGLPHRYVRQEDRKKYLHELKERILHRVIFKQDDCEIPEAACLKIGELTIMMMLEIVKIKNKYGLKVHLLSTEYRYINRRSEIATISVLKINESFLEEIVPRIEKEGDLFIHLEKCLPTIIKPLPWVDPNIGGYYLQATNLMRIQNCQLQNRLIQFADLKPVFQVLNYLSNTPWKINCKILEVVEGLWADGGGIGEIPQRYSALIRSLVALSRVDNSPQKQREYNKKIQQLRNNHSLKCDFLLKLNVAQTFAKVDCFYYPHNLDFRGRTYPVPPHLNHIGNDLARGLLLFAEGRPLGESGLKWLKIHCSNLMDFEKATIPEKLNFVENNMSLIHSIAANPLENRAWLQYQNCWQALAAIIELVDALKHEDPTKFVSYLHIHQDGSCNGLQHYAALGRDMEGAYQVNLGVTERPSDIYTYVAMMVKEMIRKEIEDGSCPEAELCQRLSENIKRKTIKQTVMTSVYGVTFIGAREQIERQLKEQKFIDSEQTYRASIYLARLTLNAISNLFAGAHRIKIWLLSCAKLISQTNNPVGWITPMGLPIVQPYRSVSNLDSVSTLSQNIKTTVSSIYLPVNKIKQRSAFPPNFIHSLDSTHMLYTAQTCQKRNLTFAAVHDSFWTHAGSVDEMNGILRDEFIRLHEEPLLENLKASFQKRFPELTFPDIPERGQFNLNTIKKSIYFFS